MGSVVDVVTGRKAQKEQSKAATRAGELQQAQFESSKEDINARQDAYIAGANAYTEAYNPYIESGQQAGSLTADLSGANGPEAQRVAYASYNESPAVSFQREQGLRGLEAGLTSTGVGGGTRLKELSRFNQGLATQDFNNYYNRLNSQSNQGAQALQSQVNTRVNALSGGVNAAQNIGAFGANAATQRGGLEIAKGQAYADRFTKLGDSVKGVGKDIATAYTGAPV